MKFFKNQRQFSYVQAWGEYLFTPQEYIDSIRAAAESDPLAPDDALFYDNANRVWVTFSEQTDLMKLEIEEIALAKKIKLPHQEAK